MANNDRRYAAWANIAYEVRDALKDCYARLGEKWISDYPNDKDNIEKNIIPQLKDALTMCNSMLIAALNEQNAELMSADEMKIEPCKLSELWTGTEEEANEPAEVSDQ